jgi:hypothetical protein
MSTKEENRFKELVQNFKLQKNESKMPDAYFHSRLERFFDYLDDKLQDDDFDDSLGLT